MSEVEIQYCAPCGTLDQARQLSAHLFDHVDGIDGVQVTNVDEAVSEQDTYDGDVETVAESVQSQLGSRSS